MTSVGLKTVTGEYQGLDIYGAIPCCLVSGNEILEGTFQSSV